eukprot:10716-Heterococcus_DN1.PRE.1
MAEAALSVQCLGKLPVPSPGRSGERCSLFAATVGSREANHTQQLRESPGGDFVSWESLAGHAVYSSYSSYPGQQAGGEEAPLASAVRCRFDLGSGAAGWSLCAPLTPNQMSVHAKDGSRYDVPLPFDAAKLLPLGQGLILQAAPDPFAEADVDGSGDVAQLPSLFTLSHPLDEVKPVEVLDSTGTAVPLDPAEELVFTSQADGASAAAPLPLLVTYNRHRARQSLWLIKPWEPDAPGSSSSSGSARTPAVAFRTSLGGSTTTAGAGL